MKAKAALAALGVVVLLVSGCRAAHVPGADDTRQGIVTFSATATSVIAKEGDPLSIEEAKLAAATLAKAALLGKIKGEFLTSTVTVDGLMFEAQEATSTVEGYMARARVTFEEQPRIPEPTIVTATAELDLSPAELARLGDYVE